MISIAVVGHYTRAERFERLAAVLEADRLYLDQDDRGPPWGHIRALADHADRKGHLLVIEDDALPCPDLRSRALEWSERFPADLISHYLGRGHPANFQNRIDMMLKIAERRRRDFINLPGLLHGVCYSIPCAGISTILQSVEMGATPIDQRIGSKWFRIMRRQILYTIPSLVDHDDDVPSLVEHRSGRTAWRPPGELAELGLRRDPD